MIESKLRATLTKYQDLFKTAGIKPIKHDECTLATDYKMQLEHCYWMVNEIFLTLEKAHNPWLYDPDEMTSKAHRWLGFLQGVLWAQANYTIEQLKSDNR